ncbi:adenosylcobinamide amidohydrolase [Thiorhodococcus fuscus]|uniref:Adenosylcobinamide amidohydrolase n=1 Tax=Thiorhodococcus fuscus TaxID=527200 RepID=A0ABW4YAR8_9GAMM
MLLEDTDRYALRRQGRYLYADLKRPHRVLSTCRVNGGVREDLTHIANHQSCEGVGHLVPPGTDLSREAVHARACSEAGLPPATTALMATAANMQCAVLGHAAYADLSVTVAATAGVLSNATRAGDPAGWHEYPEGSRPLERVPDSDVSPDARGSGTIVTLVFISQPCTPACLVRAATLVTEGKSTAVLDLRMPSIQSSGLATGTGTDQIAIAAPLARGDDWERHWAGGHNTLGELLGRATHDAVTRCLLLQNGVCAELRRSLCSALGRHGCHETALCERARAELDPETALLFERNLLAIIHDPQSAAAAYGLAEIVDLTRAGVLHREVARESILNQAALLAAAVAVAPERFAEFRDLLRHRHALDPADLAALAVVTGFAHKWI